MCDRTSEQRSESKEIQKLKACIASTQNSLTVDQLHRDYIKLYGNPVPFKDFGHGSFASFLQSAVQNIKVTNRGGQLFVSAVASADLSHIKNFVQRQKTSSNNNRVIRKPRAPSRWLPANRFVKRAIDQLRRPPLLPSPVISQSVPVFRETKEKIPDRTPYSSSKGNGAVSREISTISNKEIVILRSTTKLEQEARRYGLKINFNTIEAGKKKRHFLCTIKCDGRILSTSYPDEKKSREEAEELAAERALPCLLKDLQKTRILPTTLDYHLVTTRLRKLLSSESEGVWWQHLREKYSEEYKETAPDDWVKKACKVEHDVSFIEPTEGQWILSLKKNGCETSTEPFLNGKCKPGSLKLPEDKLWEVSVTYIKSCNEVCLRLIGEEYSDAFEDLVTDMELHYMDIKDLPSVVSPSVNSYYACSHEDSWFRVQLLNVEGDEATVIFVDYGDTEKLPLGNIYNLEPRFLELPFQSINCWLVGLEYGIEDREVLSALWDLTHGKPLVAEIISREDGISAVLFDTSSDEDININQCLLQKLPECFPEAVLPSVGGVCEVYVSHVTPEGDINVRVEAASYKTLETLLFTARQRTAEMLGENSYFTLDLTKLYLAKFAKDGEWHRAAPRSKSSSGTGQVLLKAIDKGFSEMVTTSNIIPLECLSDLLCKLPAQVLPCRLHNVPPSDDLQWTPLATEKLNAMLPTDSEPLLLKVIEEQTESRPARVKLYQRIQPKNLLCSINDNLEMDLTLFSKKDQSFISMNSNTNGNGKRLTLSGDSGYSVNEKYPEKEKPSEPTAGLSCLEEEFLDRYELPKLGDYFEIFVTYAANPSNFAVQARLNTTKLYYLMNEMNAYYSDTANIRAVAKINPGNYYALQHTDSQWYRICVHTATSGVITGLFIDYGDLFYASPDRVQLLWPNFRQFPKQSLKAKLAGIAPVNVDWTPEDCFRFSELVENKEFVSIVLNIIHPENESTSTCKEPPTLELSLVDTRDAAVDVYIAEILVEEKRAKRIE